MKQWWLKKVDVDEEFLNDVSFWNESRVFPSGDFKSKTWVFWETGTLTESFDILYIQNSTAWVAITKHIQKPFRCLTSGQLLWYLQKHSEIPYKYKWFIPVIDLLCHFRFIYLYLIHQFLKEVPKHHFILN